MIHFRHSLKTRLLAGSMIILLFSLLLGILFSLSSFANVQQKQMTEILTEHLSYLKTQAMSFDDLDRYAHAFSVRITLVDSTGEVLYDSTFDPISMDNHLQREEIQQALTQDVGTSMRSSIHMNEMLIYVAGKTDVGTVFRVSRSYKVIQVWTKYHLQNLLASFLVLALLTFALIVLSTRVVNKALKVLTDTADQYQQGNLSHYSNVIYPREYAHLSQTLNSMATQLQKTFSELSASTVKYQALLDAMQDGVVLLDQEKSILISNTSFDRMFNQGDNAEGQCIDIFFNKRETMTVIEDALKGERLNTSVFKQLEKQYQITPSPILKHGKGVQALVVTISDITTLRRLEQIRKDFVANVSHELKTPLTAITGFSELATQEQTTLEQLRFFNSIIFSNTKRMQTLVEDLLLLASLEDGVTEIPFLAIEVESVLSQAIESCRHLADQKDISIRSSVQEGVLVWANEGLLLQALVNLLTNAIGYSDGKTAIHLKAEQSNDTVHIAVEDQGCGIAKEDQQRIFERFYRVDKARSRKEGGTGLGLAIVKHIATIHQGSVSVKSTLGKGSTFILHINAAKR